MLPYARPMPWRDVSDAPTSSAALAYRRSQLRAAWREIDVDRDALLRGVCRDRRVLDLGCVDEGARELGTLHRTLVAEAASCVGLDYDHAGVEVLRAAGHDVLVGDITHPPSDELCARGPFDVVVAGELIEHLDTPAALFCFAGPLLAPGGELVLTTPNPYALHRTRAGWGRVVWENADHVTYLFPSGIAELADRCGMELGWYGTVRGGELELPATIWPSARRRMMRTVRRSALARRLEPVVRPRLCDTPPEPELPWWYVPPIFALLRRRDWAAMRETAVYSVRAVRSSAS
jgi:2-polyprenyl-3-methyl-5-hydroxy-6-metoxy-1,4-benzoquinol methylase